MKESKISLDSMDLAIARMTDFKKLTLKMASGEVEEIKNFATINGIDLLNVIIDDIQAIEVVADFDKAHTGGYSYTQKIIITDEGKKKEVFTHRGCGKGCFDAKEVREVSHETFCETVAKVLLSVMYRYDL